MEPGRLRFWKFCKVLGCLTAAHRKVLRLQNGSRILQRDMCKKGTQTPAVVQRMAIGVEFVQREWPVLTATHLRGLSGGLMLVSDTAATPQAIKDIMSLAIGAGAGLTTTSGLVCRPEDIPLG